MTLADQLVTAIRMLPGQLAADLLLGLPLIGVLVLVLLAGGRRTGR